MARLILTEPGEDVDVGGKVTVIGTSSGGEVINILRGDIDLDPSFNLGGDTIKLPDIAAQFTVRIAGSAAILIGSTTTVSIPIGPVGLQVAFDDVTRTLVFDTALGVAKLGAQVLTESDTGVLPLGAATMIVGTDGADTIIGTGDNDVIDGLGNNDSIDGRAGDDFIRGGLGDDVLVGGSGDDEIYGGAGNDRITDDEGDYALLDGGTGNDSISVNNSQATVLSISGGDGNDIIDLNVGDLGIAYVVAGSGADRISIISSGMEVNLQLGGGRDEIILPANALKSGDFGEIVIQDFAAGTAGDKVDLSASLSAYLIGWDSSSNPFDGGFLRLINRFDFAVLQVDRDGTGGSAAPQDLITFAGVSIDALTAENLSGYVPPAAAVASAASAASAASTLSFDNGAAMNLSEPFSSTALATIDLLEPFNGQQGYYFLA